MRCDDRAEQRARVAAQVVVAQRQLVDALQQHRQPVGRRDRRRERVDAGLQRLVAQQPRAEAVERRDGQLLVGRRRAAPRCARAARRRRVAPRRQREDALGRARPARPATRSARRATVVLPVPAPARTSSGPPGWVDGLRAGRREAVERSGTSVGYGRLMTPPARRSTPTGSARAGARRGAARRCSPSTRRPPSASRRPARAARAATARSRSTRPPRTPSSRELERAARRGRAASPRSARSAGRSTSATPACSWSSTRSTAR